MNWYDVPFLTIPEGEVESITDNTGTIMWTKAHVYGVSWAGNSSPLMTRTDDAASFSSPVIGNGGSSPFDNCYPWNQMVRVTDGAENLVAIPKFYYKWTKSGSTMKLQIADRKVPGFLCSPAHADRGDGAGERDLVYIGRYKCAWGYHSVSKSQPLGSMTIGTARSNIKALGTGYYQQDYAMFWTLRMLFLVEFATWDAQSVLQNTANYDAIANVRTGDTDSMTYHTGISANGYSVQYRYIEDLWENHLEWIDGIYHSGTSLYVINNPANNTGNSGGVRIGTLISSPANGYISAWTIPTISGLEWALIPSALESSEGYVCDGYYYVSTGTNVYVGGSRSSWELHGLFFMYTDFTASNSSSSVGTRLMKLP